MNENKVSFKLNDKIINGTIFIIDRNGCFEFPDETCYDIIGDDGVLYKHVRQNMLI